MSDNSGRSKSAGPDPHRWLVSYADYMTLLCAFFIMLYALQLIDEEEGAAIRSEIEAVFSNQLPITELPVPQLSTPLAKGNGLLPLLADIRQVTQIIPESDDIEVNGEEDWISVSLNADLLFASGQTRLRDEALPLIEAIAEHLRGWPFPINVQGHSDDTPATGVSNWEISVLRAASVVQNLVLYGVAPQRMAAMGMSHYHPVDEGSSDEAKAKNRRVVIFMTQGSFDKPWSRPSEP
ncbi:flagellar motor protein MotB [Bacterioplanoides sp.]|uniref:flagellar motor protein MotB n=1 Tax=Bacterioplanoides sp. TaxID=2066072 RepID=UPI003B004DB2